MEGAGTGGTVERTEVTRVFIISEVRLYREGLEPLLRGDSRLDVVGTAGDVPDALARLPELEQPPDAVLLDVPAPVGLRAPGQLEAAAPAARIVALNVSADEDVIAWAETGIGGLLDGEVDVDEVIQAIETTAHGGTVCSPKLASVLLQRVARGPPRDADRARARDRRADRGGALQQGDRRAPRDRAPDGQEPRPQHPHQAQGDAARPGGGDAARRSLSDSLRAAGRL